MFWGFKRSRGLTALLCLCLILITIQGCYKDELEDLQNRVQELESVINGDLIITSQEQLNALKSRKIKTVVGKIEISGCANLLPLSYLETVKELYIDAEDLYAFKGLENLNSCDYLRIWNLSKFYDFNAFNGLTKVKNIDINIGASEFLIEGFENVGTDPDADVEGIRIGNYWNSKFTVSGFNNLSKVEYLDIYGGDVTLPGFEKLIWVSSLNIYANSATGLNNIAGLFDGNWIQINTSVPFSENFLSGIQYVDWLSLESQNITSLAEFNLNRIEKINGLDILWMYQLSDLTGIDFGSFDINYLHIYGCENLTNISALSTLKGSLEGLRFGGAGISSFEGLENITSIGSLQIEYCRNLKDISQLSSLNTSMYDLYILDNDSLTSLNGLQNVQAINYMYIYGNGQLDDWCAIKDIFDKVGYSYVSDNLVNPNSSADITGCDE